MSEPFCPNGWQLRVVQEPMSGFRCSEWNCPTPSCPCHLELHVGIPPAEGIPPCAACGSKMVLRDSGPPKAPVRHAVMWLDEWGVLT